MMTMLASDCSASWVTSKSLAWSWPISTSLSTMFFEQPRVMTFTLYSGSDF